MKKTVISLTKNILIIFPLLLNTSCSNMRQANDNWGGKDKVQHFLFSAAVAAAGNAYGDRQNWRHRESAQLGVFLSISLGAAKEFYDSRSAGTGWSWHDIAYDIAGAITGYSLYQTIK
ncbi:YfiM family lipoprotein [Xenorhabdus nematophila]|uniref:Lipoprotein n=1 Tax=Xenorhabdus nematophila (strain ATCC 19061 / DSM 3370 / CCUG 14189 / LMG 1036 / NCIMB 9965 / AN6) TaxID=406817 RepID=D3V9W8_XENNA|nr:YfiM family lipoprotein [Xenorhabdus nematophila]AYA39583.1 YfiM family lipoprotein [Xenorhabdus nematophila]MBA0018148.1 YfiM family lipoprotein [Xenorhabdus nematophila]MCB4424791.1 YfiM family lipoprotein [Xenorhabdus nematophila]QNJ37233.1 YfiM family lipoprotein [Xenorhabdus nematophila]CBJ89356.1 putative lipoprotein precursor [Xenorhabdus nematophila ATCC 19061]